MKAARVTVSVDDAHLGAIDDVVSALRARGMVVERVLGAVGVVTGSAEDPSALAEVAGVFSVDADREVRLRPPEDEVQ